jgi:hypothetical protein
MSRKSGRSCACTSRVVMSIITVAAALLIIGSRTNSGAASASSSPATLSQVLKLVQESVNLHKVPTDLTPRLSDFSNPNSAWMQSGPYYFGACDAYNFPSDDTNPKPCIFGNIHSSETIAIVGDSNSGNWVDGLDLGLRSTKFRLAAFPFSSCMMPDITYTESEDGSKWHQCNIWHDHVPSAILKLHPMAVIVVSGPWGGNISNSIWVKGMASFFNQITDKKSSIKRLLIGTIPWMPSDPVDCLSEKFNPSKCSLNYTSTAGSDWKPGSSLAFRAMIARDAEVIKATGAKYIDPKPWICYHDVCSPVIGKYLVYYDYDHFTIDYGEYLSGVITNAVMADVKP